MRCHFQNESLPSLNSASKIERPVHGVVHGAFYLGRCVVGMRCGRDRGKPREESGQKIYFRPCKSFKSSPRAFRCTGSEYTFLLLGQKESIRKEKGHQGDALLPLAPLDSAAATFCFTFCPSGKEASHSLVKNKGSTSLTTGPFVPRPAQGRLRPLATVGMGQSALRRLRTQR